MDFISLLAPYVTKKQVSEPLRPKIQQPTPTTFRTIHQSTEKAIFNSNIVCRSTKTQVPVTNKFTVFHKKTNLRFDRDKETAAENRRVNFRENLREKRTQVMNSKRVGIGSVTAPPTKSRPVGVLAPRSQNEDNKELGMSDARRQQLLRWKQEKGQLLKQSLNPPPPFKAGLAVKNRSASITSTKSGSHLAITDRIKSTPATMLLANKDRRVTRAMTAASPFPIGSDEKENHVKVVAVVPNSLGFGRAKNIKTSGPLQSTASSVPTVIKIPAQTASLRSKPPFFEKKESHSNHQQQISAVTSVSLPSTELVIQDENIALTTNPDEAVRTVTSKISSKSQLPCPTPVTKKLTVLKEPCRSPIITRKSIANNVHRSPAIMKLAATIIGHSPAIKKASGIVANSPATKDLRTTVAHSPAITKKLPKKVKAMYFDDIYKDFNGKFVIECDFLTNYFEKYTKILAENLEGKIPEEILGDIETSIGQAKLLLNSKLVQFAELLYFYLTHTGDIPVLACDLDGWWAVAIISIEKVKNQFKILDKLAENNWIPKGKVPMKRIWIES